MTTLIREGDRRELCCGKCRNANRWFREQVEPPFWLVQLSGNLHIMSKEGRSRPLNGVAYCYSCSEAFRPSAEVVDE